MAKELFALDITKIVDKRVQEQLGKTMSKMLSTMDAKLDQMVDERVLELNKAHAQDTQELNIQVASMETEIARLNVVISELPPSDTDPQPVKKSVEEPIQEPASHAEEIARLTLEQSEFRDAFSDLKNSVHELEDSNLAHRVDSLEFNMYAPNGAVPTLQSTLAGLKGVVDWMMGKFVSIPAVPIPAVSIPAVSIPAVPIPAVPIPAVPIPVVDVEKPKK